MTFENDVEGKPSQMYNDNIEIYLVLTNDDFNDLNGITYFDVKNIFGDGSWRLFLFYDL